ncbi:MAG: hypothetical protein ACI9NT_001870 [Bacteroidia bacterium]|jgi:hypothetical protein
MMLAFSTMQQQGEASSEMDDLFSEGLQRLIVPLRRAREQGFIRDDLSIEALDMSLNAVFNSLLQGYLIGKVELDRFAIPGRSSFWLQLSAAATATYREDFLANAVKESAKAGF